MDFDGWIAEYTHYLKAHGYTARARSIRLKHLRALQRFVVRRAMNSLEEFQPNDVALFLRYWVRHQPGARQSRGSKRPSRFTPHHHLAVHYSLRSFFRWAHATGRMKNNPFPCERPCAVLIAFRNWLTTCAS